MPTFSEYSKGHLVTCDQQLQDLFNEVIKHYNCRVLCGHRAEEAQNLAYESGASQVRWPNGQHNSYPSMAVDVVPYPVDWDDLDRFKVFIGFVLGVASQMDIAVRSGIDWDGDWNFKDQQFVDMPHFELI